MTNTLLIIIAIMILITMISSIITTILVVNQSKDKDLKNKILKGLGITLLVVIVIGAAVGVSTMDKNTTKENETSQATELDQAGFNEVTIDEYLRLIAKDEKSIVLVARPTCSYCQQFTPILKQAMEDMNLTVNYIDTDKFSEEDWNTFSDSLDYLKNERWGTPLTLIVQNNKSIAENNGYVELETIKEFFKTNGLGE